MVRVQVRACDCSSPFFLSVNQYTIGREMGAWSVLEECGRAHGWPDRQSGWGQATQGRAAVIAQPDSEIDPQPATHPRLPSQEGRQVNNNLRIMCLTKPTTHPEKKAKSGPPPRLTRHLSRRASTVSRLGRQARQSRRRLWLACSRQAVRSWRLCQPFCTPLKDPVHKSGRQPRNHSALHWPSFSKSANSSS